jgi:preprotein translocase subunit SecG
MLEELVSAPYVVYSEVHWPDSIYHEARNSLKTTLRIAEIILAGSLIVLILMQSRGTSLGSVFGQEGSVFHTRRGAERILFNVSIGVAFAFLIISVALAHVNV